MNEPVKTLFETSWEVCNVVGGINTVLKSKAAEAVREFGENYIAIGPRLFSNSRFIEDESPAFPDAADSLMEKKISIKTGRWDIEGQPKVVLVDFKGAFPDHGSLLFHLWEEYGVDSMFGSWEYIEPVLFSTACAMVIEEICRSLEGDRDIYAHFHEWMCGAGLLYLKEHMPEVNTVFTTHATILGRAMSGSGYDIYSNFDEIDPVPASKKYNITAKYSMESVSAREADCFTAVSDITSREAKALLGVEPDVVTPNGFNLENVPDLSKDPEGFRNAKQKLIEFSEDFLGRELKPENTKIISISGRYEFHNKGIDLLIESLSELNEELRSQNSTVNLITLFLVMGGNVGVHQETMVRMRHQMSGMERFSGISTHHLGDEQNDPIVKSCKEHNLANSQEDKCGVIFIPVFLDGNDGVINMPYYDVLKGCDAGVYPSVYEPWGYTPLESVAYSVPAITTDLAGFGIWARESVDPSNPGIKVIDRCGTPQAESKKQLTDALREWIHWDEDEVFKHKRGAREIAEQAVWSNFYSHYLEAYDKARFSKQIRLAGLKESVAEQSKMFPGTNSAQPRFRPFSVVTSLPVELKRLREIAYNLWWVWNPNAQDLYSRLDPELWAKLNHNPVALLEEVAEEKLKEAAANEAYLAAYTAVCQAFDNYMNSDECFVQGCGHITPKHPVAYYSMEFGIHESIPTYSGGLGILSGDHIKSASDLNIPFIGITLLYKYGYFRQRISKTGEQIPEYIENSFAEMPIDIVRDHKGKRLTVTLDFPGRTLFAQVWKAQVGRAALYYLDTDVEQNSPKDRGITDKLYDAETRERVEQEIILGVGGAKLLKTLGLKPSVYHLNEGHSAFLLVERITHLMKTKGLDFESAREVIKGSTVFTTHTPVPAGNEKFDMALIGNYLKNYIQQSGMTWEQFCNIGHVYAGDQGPYDMTISALKLSYKSNGVSKLHGKVSRNMWKMLYNGFTDGEIPIGHITNGVHTFSWIADEIRNILETFAGADWEHNQHGSGSLLEKMNELPDGTLWRTHCSLKSRLFDRIRNVIQANWTREGEDPALLEKLKSKLNPDALTIGFARRFAPYKRPTLLLKDVERLKKIVSDKTYPVQFIFAGKAHPADRAGADIIRHLIEVSKTEDFLGKIIFLENYNISIARDLVAGVDVWLNNPIRPLEASGTSGMKAAINGVPNCSILDGWWDEAYDTTNGWAIGKGVEYENRETQDIVDSENIYSLIEDSIIPLFYKRDNDEVPVKWVEMMKHSIRTVLPAFNTHRMVADYATDMYEPATKRRLLLSEESYKNARDLGDWKKRIANRFPTLHIRDIKVQGLHGDSIHLGHSIRVELTLDKGRLDKSEILAETVVQDKNSTSDIPFCAVKEMKLTSEENNVFTYETTLETTKNGQFRYGVRVIPTHPMLGSKYETGLIVWS